MDDQALELLKAFVSTPSPSGFEQPVARLYRDYVQPFAHKVTTDIMGNVSAAINPDAAIRFMYAGHMDEIGFIVHHIDENGFLFFSTIGGTDVATEIGQRVLVHGHESVPGVIGRKAIQAFHSSDFSQTPSLKDLWIDIGAASREEAEKVVEVGSPVTIDAGFSLLGDRLAVGRAFDNKVGLMIGAELVRRLSQDGDLHPDVGFYLLGTVQEEIGSRGARTAGFNLAPRTALAIDMGVAMDYPRARPEDQGKLDLGKGPGISQGANTNPVMYDLLISTAKENGIPYQRQATGGKSPTDARVVQELHGGVATAVISVPLRYMHTPSEVVCLDDIQATIDLVHGYCRRLRPDIDFTPM
ncbi:M42 family metallopeptidase [Paracoccus benzoatiresistens]|uniref:M20/M25/M40 family metallo-hydrolase n=1 Tax=Paracoccus benzoatiresistens TaxID=2997341 RepID=A0ABT4J1R2_9RHOB|nr:M20/M25/M40 family metallo-hydrolase [Paracoccus sp. EF6]MCZ0961049.1 M20/M25/M40 family metallo-hydrolase [Paracoccus sp. EF6]